MPTVNSKTRQKIRAQVTYLLQLQGVPREGTDSAWLGWKEGRDGSWVVLEAHPVGSRASWLRTGFWGYLGGSVG